MPAGRPPTFDKADALQDAIDAYFKEGVTVKSVVIGKAPSNYTIQVHVPTITGLCHYIGFDSRQSFYAYEKKVEFSYTVKRARLFIEKHYEEMLQTGNTIGAIFALKNFDWKDKHEVELPGAMVWDVTLNINGGTKNQLHKALGSGISEEDTGLNGSVHHNGSGH